MRFCGKLNPKTDFRQDDRNNRIHRKIYGVLEVTQNMECLSNCKQLILCSVLFVLFVSSVSSVVNSPGVVSESDSAQPVVKKWVRRGR